MEVTRSSVSVERIEALEEDYVPAEYFVYFDTPSGTTYELGTAASICGTSAEYVLNGWSEGIDVLIHAADAYGKPDFTTLVYDSGGTQVVCAADQFTASGANEGRAVLSSTPVTAFCVVFAYRIQRQYFNDSFALFGVGEGGESSTPVDDIPIDGNTTHAASSNWAYDHEAAANPHGTSYSDVGAAASSHAHGNITNAGAIGSTSGIPIITGTSGVLQAMSTGEFPADYLPDITSSNMFEDSGRFAGRIRSSLRTASSFVANSFFTPTNSSTSFIEAGKFIYNNTDFGGSAGSMTSTTLDLLSTMGRTGINARYGVEFFIAQSTMGSGTSSPYSSRYLFVINEGRALPGINYCSLSFWIRALSNDVLIRKYTSVVALYKNGVDQGSSDVIVSSSDGWVHIFERYHTSVGYEIGAPYLYSTSGTNIQIALPFIVPGIVPVRVHTVPFPSVIIQQDIAATAKPQFAGLGIGTSTFGTSITNALVLTNGVAASTYPADTVQVRAADVNGSAGYSGLHMQNEQGHNMVIVGTTIKTDTGDPSNPHEGMMVINTYDNTVKLYADGGWRTLASGW